jgi:hypothetical protein
MVIHACDPSYPVGISRRLVVRPAQAKNKTLSKKNNLKQKGLEACLKWQSSSQASAKF